MIRAFEGDRGVAEMNAVRFSNSVSDALALVLERRMFSPAVV
jgi:hypothetical protein